MHVLLGSAALARKHLCKVTWCRKIQQQVEDKNPGAMWFKRRRLLLLYTVGCVLWPQVPQTGTA